MSKKRLCASGLKLIAYLGQNNNKKTQLLSREAKRNPTLSKKENKLEQLLTNKRSILLLGKKIKESRNLNEATKTTHGVNVKPFGLFYSIGLLILLCKLQVYEYV